MLMMPSTKARQSLVEEKALVPPSPVYLSPNWRCQAVNGSGFPLEPSGFALWAQFGGFHLMTARYVGTSRIGGTLAGKADSRRHK